MNRCTVVVSPATERPNSDTTYSVLCMTCHTVMHEDTTHPEFHLMNHLTGKDPGVPLKIALKKHRRKKKKKKESHI